eukprot:gnl/MRDRNA2_/MRDRNA2_98503_c0_seq1.p1 gnl/MRDRNA2_/MRDRNA2_98503_c0~~gnl/MRDRNA2_/MRDRNA2_98503_c0_seq1.p1  ORF type:complete len:408 (+),score=83.89 gnl/MRDRNA2_/MRDRNA2_98503_c0_seq1:141-1226(+)
MNSNCRILSVRLSLILFSIIALSPVYALRSQKIAKFYHGVVSNKAVPAQEVLQTLNSMLVNSTKAKSEAQVIFSEYEQFCESMSTEKSHAVMVGKFQAAQLQAMISKAAVDVTTLSSEIEFLTNDIEALVSQKAMIDADRCDEHAHFTAIHNDYISAIDIVGMALQGLVTSPSLTRLVNSLLPLRSLSLQSTSTKALMALSPYHDDPSSLGVVAMVGALHKTLKDDMHELEKEEAQQKYTSDMAKRDLQISIDKITQEQFDKMAAKAQCEQTKAKAKTSLLDTAASIAADMQVLDDLTQVCIVKALEYEGSQSLSLRSGSIEAILQTSNKLLSKQMHSSNESKSFIGTCQSRQVAMSQTMC